MLLNGNENVLGRGEKGEFIVSVHSPHLPAIPISTEMEVMKFWEKKYKKFDGEI